MRWLTMLAGAMVMAQEPQRPPSTYSYQLTTLFFKPDAVTMQVDRDHDRERIEFTIAPKGFRPKPDRKRVLFDFTSQLIYIKDSSGCRVVKNELGHSAPPMMDPLGSAWTFEDPQPKILRQEMINGFPARVIEYQGDRYWLSKDYGFPLRKVDMNGGQPLHTSLDVRGLRFAKPPAPLFAIPEGCETLDLPPLDGEPAHWEQPLKLEAAPLRLPLTYSLRWVSFGRDAIEVDRDHEVEAVVVTRLRKRTRIRFDFARHSVSVEDDIGCRETGYLLEQASWEMDPVSPIFAGGLLHARPKILRRELVNGMAARVVEEHDAGPYQRRMWLAEEYDFPLRQLGIPVDNNDRPTGLEKHVEVLNVRYSVPAASRLAPPKTPCEAVAGEIGEDWRGWEEFVFRKQ